MSSETSTKEFYDKVYKRPNYFSHHNWTCRAYVSSLIALSSLRRGSSVLDVGCGQGLFSHFFAKEGMRVCGVDLSETGISVAEKLYGQPGLRFIVADAQTASFPAAFDCVFVRSCSAYHSESFSNLNDVTNDLMKHLKPGGIFIFAHNSNFSRKNNGWRQHSLGEAREHFEKYQGTKVFFVYKAAIVLLGRFAFNAIMTQLGVMVSRTMGVGGDIVCIARKGDV